jgi:hypothetical protein
LVVRKPLLRDIVLVHVGGTFHPPHKSGIQLGKAITLQQKYHTEEDIRFASCGPGDSGRGGDSATLFEGCLRLFSTVSK